MEKKPVSHFAAGIILGLISVVLFLLYYFTGIAFKSGFLSFVPSLVIIGLIIYFITKYSNDTGHNSTFGALFGYGFKCTIIWVLIAVAFALLMMYIFPDYREKVLEQTRINLDKQVALTESQKDTYVKAFEDHFTLYIVGGALFLDLLMGLIASLIGAAVAKKNPVTPFNQSV